MNSAGNIFSSPTPGHPECRKTVFRDERPCGDWDSGLSQPTSDHAAREHVTMVFSNLICTAIRRIESVSLQVRKSSACLASNSRRRRVQIFAASEDERGITKHQVSASGDNRFRSIGFNGVVVDCGHPILATDDDWTSVLQRNGGLHCRSRQFSSRLTLACARHPARTTRKRVDHEKRNADQCASAGRKPDCDR